jgi:hypothetical protein
MMSVMACSTSLQAQKPLKLESLYGVKINEKSIVIKVYSFGCTKAKDFSIEEKSGSLNIVRVKIDRCRKMPELVTLRLPFNKLLDNYQVLNPIKKVKKKTKY